MNTTIRDKSRTENEVDKTGFEKFEETVKLAIFNVLYVLLSDDEEGESGSKWTFFTMIITDYIQLFDFIFTPMMEFPWKQDGFMPFQTFLDSLTVGVWFSNLETTIYLVIVYIMYFIVFLAVLDILYVSYSFSKKKFTFIWPLKALRSTVSLFVSALFVPFLETFATMVECDINDDGTSTLSIHPEILCWHGFHILHATLAAICSIVFVTIALVSSLCYYESRNVENDISAKVNSRADVFYVIIKITISFMYAFLKYPRYHWPVITVIFVLSFISLCNYRFTRPYYSDTMNTYFVVLSGVFFWGVFVLLLTKILEQTSYDGGVQLYFLGIPLIVSLILFEKDDRPYLLLQNLNQFQKGEDANSQIRYFLQIIRNRDKDRKSHIILKGYIHYHEDQCLYQDCQLKIIKNNESLRGSSSLHDQRIKAQDFQLLVQHAKNMYRAAIVKFPTCTSLKIQYALFLMEWMKQKQESLSMLDQAIVCNPPFDEQFVIFRYKKIFEEFGLSNNNGSGELDIVAQYAYESTLRQLYETIFKTAKLYSQFWKTLIDNHNITKLNECGHKINQSIITVESHWTYLQKIHPNDQKAIKIYSQFLIQILNDKDAGQELIDISKDAQNNQKYFEGKNNQYGMGNDLQSLIGLSTPYVKISGQIENIGMITQCNLTAYSLFGYTSDEMKNHNVNRIMPEFYAKHHEQILLTALTKGATNIQKQDQLIFAKHKSGFIFPVRIQFKMTENVQGQIMFIAIFTLDKKMINTNTGFIIINKERKIQGLSSSCMNIMNVDYHQILRIISQQIKIEKLTPNDIFKDHLNQGNYQQKGEERTLDWYPSGYFNELSSKDEKIKGLFRINSHKENVLHKNKLQLKYHLTPIKMGEIGDIGWQLKLEIKNDQMRNSYSLKSQDSNTPYQKDKGAYAQKVRQPLFQFRFDYPSGKFIREIKDGPLIDNAQRLQDFGQLLRKQSTLKLKQRIFHQEFEIDAKRTADAIQETKKKEEVGTKNEENVKIESILEKKKSWSYGIQTYRLSNGKFMTKESEEQLLKLQQTKEKVKNNELHDNDEFSQKSNFHNDLKSRKTLQNAIYKKSVPKEIKNLKRTINLVMIFFLILSITDFAMINNQLNELIENFNLIHTSYNRISEIQRIAYNARTLIMINEKKQIVYKNYTTDSNFTKFIFTDIQQALDNLYVLHNIISLSDLSISSQQKILTEQKSVALYFQDKETSTLKTLKFTLSEAVLQIASAVFTIQHMDLIQFSEEQQDLFFVTYNSFNDFLQALRMSSKYYADEQVGRIDQKNSFILIIFISSIAIMIVSLMIIFPVINKVNFAKSKILLLFVDIPKSQVITLSEKCERYMANFDNEEDNDDAPSQIETDENQQHTDEQKHELKNNNKKFSPKYHQSKVSNLKFFTQFGVAALVTLVYFIVMFVLSLIFIKKIRIAGDEINTLAQAESYYSFAQNVQREMIYNPDKLILNQNSFLISKQSIEQLSNLNKLVMHDVHINEEILTEEYITAFNQIYQSSLCEDPIYREELIPYECTKFLSSSPNHGFQLVITKYFESLKESLKLYIIYQEQGINPMKLINSDLFLDLYIIQYRYIQGAYRELVGVLDDATNILYQSIVDTRMIGFILFLMGLILAYLTIWLPYVSNLTKEIWRTKSMLRIIPIEVIQSMPGFMDFMESQDIIKQKKKST